MIDSDGYWLTRQTRRFRRRTAVKGAAISAAALALAACQSQTKQITAGKAATGGTAQHGGTLTLREDTDFNDFDPTYHGESVPNKNATTLAYDTLTGFQQGANVPYTQLTIQPKLAQSWEVAEGATTYTFHLRKGVTFANLAPVNGRAVTADDVKWSFEYHSRTGAFSNTKLPASTFAWMLEGIEQIQTPDPSTVVMHFKQPFAPFLPYVSADELPILPHEVYDQDGHFHNRPIGSGPFQLDKATTQVGARWTFKPNTNYWQSGKPYLDSIVYLILPDDSSMYAAFQTHQIDIMDLQDPAAEPALKKNNPDAIEQSDVDPAPTNLFTNVRRPPFSDLRVRQAISLSIDRDEFDKTLSASKGGWGMSGAAPGSFTQAEIKQILKYDPNQAKSLLAQAGYPNGLQAKLLLRMQAGPMTVGAQLIQSQLKKGGFDLTIEPVDNATGSKRLHSGDFDISFILQNEYPDPDGWLYGTHFSTSPLNQIGVKDPKFDQLLLAQRQEADPNLRPQKIKDAATYLAQNAYDLALWFRINYELRRPNVQNYANHWLQYNWNAPDVWLQK